MCGAHCFHSRALFLFERTTHGNNKYSEAESGERGSFQSYSNVATMAAPSDRPQPIPMQLNYEESGEVEPVVKRPVTILLTTSEGITSPGLLTMIRILLARNEQQKHIDANTLLRDQDLQMPFYIHGILVVCPDRPQPWASHAVTMNDDIVYAPYTFDQEQTGIDPVGIVHAYVHSGTPVDSIRLGTTKLYEEVFGRACSDHECFVISGLNTTPAVGGNQMYSADVACVREARAMGLTAMNFYLIKDFETYKGLWHYDSVTEIVVRVVDFRLHDALARVALGAYTPVGSNIGLPNTPDSEFYNSKPVQMALSGSSRTTTIAYHLEAWERDDKGRVVCEIPGATDPRRRLKPVSVYTCIDDPEKSTDDAPIDTIVHSRTPNVTITSVNPLNEFFM